MAHPFLFEENFESGSKGNFDTETDTGALLDFVHYTELARFPWSNAAPYRGAYCVRIQCGDTNDHTLSEGSLNIADGSTASIRFFLYFAPNFTATADDVFSIFEWQQDGGTVEATMGIRITAATGDIEIGVGDGTAPSAYAAQKLVRDRWYCIEATVKCSTSDAGTVTLYIDGVSSVALTSQDHAAAIGLGVLGTQLTLATTTGTILLDWFTFDDLRIYPITDRWPKQRLLTMSEHVVLGPGEISNVTLIKTAATDNVVDVFDTDTANTNDAWKVMVLLQDGGATVGILDPAGMPIEFKRGAFVRLTGTDIRALVNICRSTTESTGRIRNHGLRRSPNPLEV